MNNSNGCAVCGNNDSVEILNSFAGAVSFRYCKKCKEHEYEPYSFLVSMGIVYNELTDAAKTIIDKNLCYYQKTREDFNRDVREYIKVYQ